MASPATSSQSQPAVLDEAITATQQVQHLTTGATEVTRGSEVDDDDGTAAQSPSTVQSTESGEASPVAEKAEPTEAHAADAQTAESSVGAPPLPSEAPPASENDGWEFHWDADNSAYFFHNRLTGESTWENPRTTKEATVESGAAAVAEPPKDEKPPAGGYNPAIHGDYDPTAWYAQTNNGEQEARQNQPVDPAAAYAAIGSFNRFTGRWQSDALDPEQHNDENKSHRQMNAFFDVDAAANSHDGRSLKAERSGKKPTKTELKEFKEKRKAKKEEKRRAWLRD